MSIRTLLNLALVGAAVTFAGSAQGGLFVPNANARRYFIDNPNITNGNIASRNYVVSGLHGNDVCQPFLTS